MEDVTKTNKVPGMMFVDYKFYTDRFGKDVISFDEELTADKLGVVEGDLYEVQVNDGRVEFVLIDA